MKKRLLVFALEQNCDYVYESNHPYFSFPGRIAGPSEPAVTVLCSLFSPGTFHLHGSVKLRFQSEVYTDEAGKTREFEYDGHKVSVEFYTAGSFTKTPTYVDYSRLEPDVFVKFYASQLALARQPAKVA